eukprot:PhM_4_TR13800/c0_g1_i1/m.70669/K09518/DNAJB12; DnaJ homolog subfamily B member 12
MSDDAALIRRINGTKCHYTILGVTRTAGTDEIKAKYRQLALRLHPDKNQLPGAEDAFKAVGRAYATLSDQQKRNTYDQYGEAGVQAQESGSHPSTSRYGGGHARHRQHYQTEEEVLFQMFEDMFGGAFGGGGAGRRPRQRHPHDGGAGGAAQRPNNSTILFFTQVAPILLLMLVYLLSSGSFFGEPMPGFALAQQGSYSQPRTTRTLGPNIRIKYYVEASFNRKFGHATSVLRDLEQRVLHEHVQYLARRCVFEQLDALQVAVRDSTADVRRAKDEDDLVGVRQAKRRLDEAKADLDKLRAASSGSSLRNLHYDPWRRGGQGPAGYKSVVRDQCEACKELDGFRRQVYG